MNSLSPGQEGNLRSLLDHRAARVGPHHTRFPSLSEFSDSPSIYSHAHFSPRPPYIDSSPPQFDFSIPPQYARPSLEAVRPFPTSPAGKQDSGTHRADPTFGARPGRSHSSESVPSEEDSDPRMSFLGPTMRFHSPAPWEMEDAIREDGGQEDDARSILSKRSRSKTRGEGGFIKNFGRAAPARSISTARPSIESVRSVNSTRDKTLVDNQPAHTTIP